MKDTYNYFKYEASKNKERHASRKLIQNVSAKATDPNCHSSAAKARNRHSVGEVGDHYLADKAIGSNHNSPSSADQARSSSISKASRGKAAKP
jgi:hypothetical protein